jgi:hypothetical protein
MEIAHGSEEECFVPSHWLGSLSRPRNKILPEWVSRIKNQTAGRRGKREVAVEVLLDGLSCGTLKKQPKNVRFLASVV